MMIEEVKTANNLTIDAEYVYTLHEEKLKVFICQGRLLFTNMNNWEVYSLDIREIARMRFMEQESQLG